MKIKYKAINKPAKSWMPDGEWIDFALRGGGNIMVFDYEPVVRDTGILNNLGTPFYAFEQSLGNVGFFEFEDNDD